MLPTVATAAARLGERVPLSKAASWDAVGLQVGDPEKAVRTVAVCHEVTDAVMEALQHNACDLVVSYHPLLFRPTGRFVAGSSAGGRAFRLAAAGTALYVVHTAFDVLAGGCADALADAVGLTNIVGLGANWPPESAKIVTYAPAVAVDSVVAAMAGAGAGEVGAYTECSFTVDGVGHFRPAPGSAPAVGVAGEMNHEPEVRVEMTLPVSRRDTVVAALVAAHPYEEPAYDVYATTANAGFVGRVGDASPATSLAEFAAVVAESLRADVRSAGDRSRPVSRVAVVPGSGADFTHAATAAGADVIVTGDVSHHRANEAIARGLAVVDAGHAATERPGVARLYSLVSEMFATTIDMTDLDPNPWESSQWKS